VVLYDANKRLIAINEQTLETLGYSNLEEFKKEIYDISQLFIKRAGYIYEFKNFHWIDYVLTNSTITHRAILKKKDGGEFETFVKVNQLSGITRDTFYYLVTFELNTFQEQLCEPLTPSKSTALTQEPPLKNHSKEFPKPNLEEISIELNLSSDIIQDFIQEYIHQALEKFEEVQKYIEQEDQKKLFTTLHTLKGVAGNLRLRPAFETLSLIKKDTPVKEMIPLIKEYYEYINFLANEFGISTSQTSNSSTKSPSSTQSTPSESSTPKKDTTSSNPALENVAKELGLSIEEYQEYLKELINEIKVNLAYNNYNELRKLASFARNLYLQECAKYLDQVNIHQDPNLVKQCLKDLEELRQEPNPFIVTLQDLNDSLELTQIDKENFIDIIEDLIIELKALNNIKMRKEKFLKKVKQLKSVAESLRLSNLVLLLNNIISNYPLNEHLIEQLNEAINALESNVKQL